MKKNIKNIFLLLIVTISLIFYPSNTYAVNEKISYVNINNIKNLEVGSLAFSNISFRDYSSTSTKGFGLTGTVTNNSNHAISYTATVYYYDSNYNLIALESSLETTVKGISTFNQMSNLSILDGHNVSEISYYSLSINTKNYSNSEEIINSIELTPSKNDQYKSYDYVIDKYDINITVNENNTFEITEKIKAYFNIPRHGIIRTIPLKNKITRLDGTTSTNRTQVTNVSVNNEYRKKKENDDYKLKIGSANHTLTGEQEYIIKYTYNLGKDYMKDYDEIYYNIIGTDWDTVIGNITFSITMPKEFDSSKLGFSSGKENSIANGKVKYSVSKNKIIGSYNGILDSHEALTIRCELPEGYFVGAKLNKSLSDYITFLCPLVFLGISILLWYIFGRDNKVVETIEFYPPEGLNSLEIGFLYKGKAKNKDVTSLLIDLANRGYIEIVDMENENFEKSNFRKNTKNSTNKKIRELQNKINEERKNNPNSQKIKYYENMLDIYKNIDKPIDYEQYGLKQLDISKEKKDKFYIRKIKDYDGLNLNEQWFMEGLFSYDKTEVTEEMLYNNFYITNNKILHNINNKNNRDKIFEKSSASKKWLIILMITVTNCIISISPIFNSPQPEGIIFALIFIVIVFPIIFGLSSSDTPSIAKVIFLIVISAFYITIWTSTILPTLMQEPSYLINYIIGVICIIGMIICLVYIPKRTKYGNEILGRIIGFKRFLETVEKEKLESLVMENPNYFYNILPYAYVLGVTDKWIKKFETISLQEPSWYNSHNDFNFSSFETFVTSTMVSAQSAMSSLPPNYYMGTFDGDSSGGSSSSGSSSGGGSSGGGSGGGGGSSW